MNQPAEFTFPGAHRLAYLADKDRARHEKHRARCRVVVAGAARDAADARLLLNMLGLLDDDEGASR